MTLLRTMLFVPGYRKKFLENSIRLNSDALILDLEDSVPFAFKNEARQNIRDFVSNASGKKQIFVRLNSLSSGLMTRDLDAVLCENVDGFMPSMIKDEQELIYIDQLIADLEQRRFRKRQV